MQTIYIFYNKKTLLFFEDYINSLVSATPQNLIKLVPWQKISEFVFNLNDIFVFIRMIPKEWLNFFKDRKHYLLNTEQLSRKLIYETFFNNINENTGILDYSLANIEIIKKMSLLNDRIIKYLPYQINDKEIKNYDKVFNVCMMDGLSERRSAIAEKIKIIPSSNIIKGFGLLRDKLLFKHKILVNIHAGDDYNVLEQMRCNRCILNKMIVISEPILDKEYELEKYMIVCPYHEIMQKVQEVLDNYERYYNKMFENFNVNDLKTKYEKISEIIV
ncbi:MAG: hypothetical protein WD512_12630 [Candidatus Paceibacterota bacterium]